MSRHLRRIERSRKASRVRTWNRYHREIRRTWCVLPDEPATITISDIDHAVALEREAIAAWVENRGVLSLLGRTGPDGAATLATAIRNGAHRANTPPNAQERG